MIDFIIKSSKLQIDPYTLTVKAFHDIWEYDKGQTKSKASNMLLYVFHICDITQKNPFKDLPEKEKDTMSRYNAFGKKDYKFLKQEQELIDEAIMWYQILNKDSIQRLSIAMNRKIDQVTDFMLEPKNDIMNPKQLDEQADMLTRIEKVLNSKKKVDDFVRNELEKTKAKGNVARSPLQKGLV